MADASANPLRVDFLAFWELTSDDDLIRLLDDQYVVYINKKGDLHWETSSEYDKNVESDSRYDLTTHNSILMDAAILEATPNDDFREIVRRESKRLIGEALVCSFENDYLTAQKMIAGAEQYLRARGEEAARFWYLRASLATAGSIVALGVATLIYRDRFISIFGSTGYWLALAFVAGSIGALLSIFSRSGNLAVGYAAGRKLLYLEGSVRVIAGAFSGVLAALAVKAEIILTAFTHGGHTEMITILAASAAGTTERLVTSLFSKLDTIDEKGLTQRDLHSNKKPNDLSKSEGETDTSGKIPVAKPRQKLAKKPKISTGV